MSESVKLRTAGSFTFIFLFVFIVERIGYRQLYQLRSTYTVFSYVNSVCACEMLLLLCAEDVVCQKRERPVADAFQQINIHRGIVVHIISVVIAFARPPSRKVCIYPPRQVETVLKAYASNGLVVALFWRAVF